jgi:hypothetical protein
VKSCQRQTCMADRFDPTQEPHVRLKKGAEWDVRLQRGYSLHHVFDVCFTQNLVFETSAGIYKIQWDLCLPAERGSLKRFACFGPFRAQNGLIQIHWSHNNVAMQSGDVFRPALHLISDLQKAVSPPGPVVSKATHYSESRAPDRSRHAACRSSAPNHACCQGEGPWPWPCAHWKIVTVAPRSQLLLKTVAWPLPCSDSA